MDWCEILENRDFFTWDYEGKWFDFIITNLVFSHIHSSMWTNTLIFQSVVVVS
jgi:hypothetical protein